MSNNEKDPLLDELEERIAEGPVMFTPDEEFLKRVAERRKEINEKIIGILKILLKKNSEVNSERLNETSRTNIQTREAS